MPTNTSRLSIPKPAGNEYFNRATFNTILDTIDNNTATKSELTAHTSDSTAHITAAERTKWNGAAADIGAKANLLTTAKTDIVSALNELFTNASNGKTAVANAVTAKGVSASSVDTFAALATKIGQIVTGKRWASGTYTLTGTPYSFTNDDGTSNNFGRVTVSGLSFTPSYILMVPADATTRNWTIVLPNKIGTNADAKIVVPATVPYRLTGNNSLSSTGFSIMFGGGYSTIPVSWIAFE